MLAKTETLNAGTSELIPEKKQRNKKQQKKKTSKIPHITFAILHLTNALTELQHWVLLNLLFLMKHSITLLDGSFQPKRPKYAKFRVRQFQGSVLHTAYLGPLKSQHTVDEDVLKKLKIFIKTTTNMLLGLD